METRRTIRAADFKTHCLALLDEVADTGEEIVVTKRGKPVARLVPMVQAEPVSLIGSVLFEGDLVSPVEIQWDAQG